MAVRNYQDLIVWKKAFQLALDIYQATSHFPNEEKYGLTAQLRRASVSVTSNIAEGEGRNSRAEFRHFLFMALGSLREAETQILIADSLQYLQPNETAKLIGMASEVGRLINGLCRSLRNDPGPTAHCRPPTVD